ncbi:MAG: lipid A biosynthesis acyltransferase [Rubrivivax sp.]|jgi:KDO2-lipid IV(A) lauroyltransferase|nr:lipid A biosynthesis acyltransferase [Rubrivivax sp.]
MGEWGARCLLAVVWLLHFLPLRVLAGLGWWLGGVAYGVAHRRRRIALRNLELCFPQRSVAEREALAREHFRWLMRSLLERSLLWHASPARLRRLIHITGDVGLADREERPVMWLVPHFVGLEVAGAAVQLFQQSRGFDIYQPQRNAVFDAALKRGRLRFGRAEAHARGVSIRKLMQRLRDGCSFFNMPDQDFGGKDASFVPFFGVPASTLLAPSRMARLMNMVVQPVVVTMLPGGQGWRVHFAPPLQGWPTDDAEADTRAMNALFEQAIEAAPAQYLWVHKRFKTRPPGEPSLYG